MINDIDVFDITTANVLLAAVNYPKIEKGSPTYELFKIYYASQISTFERRIRSSTKTVLTDKESQNLAVLYAQFIHGYMTGVFVAPVGLQAAILGITNSPLGAESI